MLPALGPAFDLVAMDFSCSTSVICTLGRNVICAGARLQIAVVGPSCPVVHSAGDAGGAMGCGAMGCSGPYGDGGGAMGCGGCGGKEDLRTAFSR